MAKFYFTFSSKKHHFKYEDHGSHGIVINDGHHPLFSDLDGNLINVYYDDKIADVVEVQLYPGDVLSSTDKVSHKWCQDHAFTTIKITNIRDIKDLDIWNDAEKYLELIQKNSYLLRFVKEQTHEMCLAAVKRNGYILQYVREQTPEICLAAVKQNGYALKYVQEQTPEICLAAVRDVGFAIDKVKEQTPELCLVAVQESGNALKYVREHTPEICAAAILRNPNAVQYVKQ
jgi:hypothetical protein